MTDFTKGTIQDVPGRPQTQKTGMTAAISALEGDDALLVPADGVPLLRVQMRVSSMASYVSRGKYSVRVDHERNGVWVFLRRDGGSA